LIFQSGYKGVLSPDVPEISNRAIRYAADLVSQLLFDRRRGCLSPSYDFHSEASNKRSFMCFFTIVGLLPRWSWDAGFLLSSLCPSFRKSRRWAEQLLDYTVEAVTEDIQESGETIPNQKGHHYKSILQRLAGQLRPDDAVGEAYGLS
jgi:hypothetical protein